METYIITIHTDDGGEIELEIEAETPDDALDLLWENENDDWIRIETSSSVTEFVNVNYIVRITTKLKQGKVKTAAVKSAGVRRG